MDKKSNRSSLKSKITRIEVFSLIFLMLSVILVTHWVELDLSKDNFQKELVVIADIIGNRSQAALVFNDEEAATRNLSAARLHPNIERLCLYKEDGSLLGLYLRSDDVQACVSVIATEQEQENLRVRDEFMEVKRQVQTQDGVIGYLNILADLSHIETNSLYLLKLLLWMLVLTLLLAQLIIVPIIGNALQPLTKLRDVANRVAENPFSPLRAKQYYDDEVGVLVKVFNTMLDRLGEESEALRISDEALRRSQKMDAVGQLTGGIAHDFNNILGIILGNVELLQMENDDSNSERIENINKSTLRAIDLTNKLLNFSRRKSATLEVTDINSLIKGMEGLISQSATPLNSVQFNLMEGVLLAEIDPGDFEDSLLNLVINANDAMPEGGRLILETGISTLDEAYCSLNIDAVPGDYIEVFVTDTGKGMSPEIQASVFEPFFTTKSPGNTGMGLSMVFGFVKRSNGHIKLYSEIGIGTTIHLYLPRINPEKPEQTSVLTAKDSIEALPTGKETVLVVDDEEGLLEIARDTLQRYGYTVITASNARDALHAMAENSVDLLFSDVVMPGGMNGYQLAEQVSTEYPFVKILLTSGYTLNSLAHNGQMRFNSSLLNKPYSQAELVRQVRSKLDEPN